MIILLGITAAAYAVAHSMTDYVYRSRLRDRYGENYREHIGEPAKAGTVY